MYVSIGHMLNDFFDTFVVDTWWAEKLYCGSLGFSKEDRSRSARSVLLGAPGSA